METVYQFYTEIQIRKIGIKIKEENVMQCNDSIIFWMKERSDYLTIKKKTKKETLFHWLTS